MSTTRAQQLVLLAAVLFGTTGTAQALGPDGDDPLTVGAARIAVAAIALLAFAAVTRTLATGTSWSKPNVAAAALGVAGYQLCFFAAVDSTGVALGTVVALGSGPAFAGLLGLALRGDRPTQRWGIATALAIGGATLLVLAGGGAEVNPAGVLLALGAGASYALYTVTGKTLLDAGHQPAGVMAVAFTGGAMALAPVLALGDASWLTEAPGAALALYLGIIPTAVAYILFAKGLEKLPAANVATLTLAEPLTAATLGVIVLGERPGVIAGAGALLVLSGLLVLAERPKRTGLTPSPSSASA